MRVTARAAGLLCALMVILPAAARAVQPGDAAPEWTLQSLDGAPVQFPQVLHGRPAVMLFWASWCPYCKALMPYLADIARERGVTVLALDFKETRGGDPRAAVSAYRDRFTVLVQADAVAEAYGVRYTPGLMVVDGDGVVRYRRKPTEAPPGKTIAQFWAGEVKMVLDAL